MKWTQRICIGSGLALASMFAVPAVAGADSTCYTGCTPPPCARRHLGHADHRRRGDSSDTSALVNGSSSLPFTGADIGELAAVGAGAIVDRRGAHPSPPPAPPDRAATSRRTTSSGPDPATSCDGVRTPVAGRIVSAGPPTAVGSVAGRQQRGQRPEEHEDQTQPHHHADRPPRPAAGRRVPAGRAPRSPMIRTATAIPTGSPATSPAGAANRRPSVADRVVPGVVRVGGRRAWASRSARRPPARHGPPVAGWRCSGGCTWSGSAPGSASGATTATSVGTTAWLLITW